MILPNSPKKLIGNRAPKLAKDPTGGIALSTLRRMLTRLKIRVSLACIFCTRNFPTFHGSTFQTESRMYLLHLNFRSTVLNRKKEKRSGPMTTG